MIRRPPRSTRTDTLFPYPTLFRSIVFVDCMKELPATLILRPFNFDTLATHVYQFASEELLERSALAALAIVLAGIRSEEHTSELQSLMSISYAVFCLKKKKHITHKNHTTV